MKQFAQNRAGSLTIASAIGLVIGRGCYLMTPVTWPMGQAVGVSVGCAVFLSALFLMLDRLQRDWAIPVRRNRR